MGYIRGARIGVAPEKPVPPGLPRAHMAGRRRKAHMIKRPNWHQHDWQPPQGRRKPTRPATLMELQLELLTMFTRIQHQVGLEKARRMFGDFAKEPTKTQRDYLEKCQWLERLDAMPWPNKAQLMKGEAARHERHPVNVAPDATPGVIPPNLSAPQSTSCSTTLRCRSMLPICSTLVFSSACTDMPMRANIPPCSRCNSSFVPLEGTQSRTRTPPRMVQACKKTGQALSKQ